MSLRRTARGDRFSTGIWPGFVDAITALLMVVIFVLSIFMIVQMVLRERITAQDSELADQSIEITRQESRIEALDRQINDLSRELGLSQERSVALEQDVATREARLAELRAARAEDQAELANLDRELETAEATIEERRAAQLALELDLEEARLKAEETLTLLAAAEAAREAEATARQEAETAQAESLSEAERQAALLAVARRQLAEEEAVSVEDQTRIALLNEQVSNLTEQIERIRALLATAEQGEVAAAARNDELSSQLNTALLAAAEERDRRLKIEEEARVAAEAEAKDLARYRSEFFGRLNEILSGRDGIEIEGDRFRFSSEVLFAAGEADLSAAGREEVRQLASSLDEIADEIPDEIDWVIRVDGHTDSLPLSGTGEFSDNWELSQARARAVVQFMADELGFPETRLAATGFADTRPIAPQDTEEGRAQNRRIELKLTEG